MPFVRAAKGSFDRGLDLKAVGWLESQLANTPEEFDASIAATKARKEAEENQAVYEGNDSGSFMPPAEPAQA